MLFRLALLVSGLIAFGALGLLTPAARAEAPSRQLTADDVAGVVDPLILASPGRQPVVADSPLAAGREQRDAGVVLPDLPHRGNHADLLGDRFHRNDPPHPLEQQP